MLVITGEIWVNNVRILKWRVEGQGLIIALEDYLFREEVSKEIGMEMVEEVLTIEELRHVIPDVQQLLVGQPVAQLHAEHVGCGRRPVRILLRSQAS